MLSGGGFHGYALCSRTRQLHRGSDMLAVLHISYRTEPRTENAEANRSNRIQYIICYDNAIADPQSRT